MNRMRLAFALFGGLCLAITEIGAAIWALVKMSSPALEPVWSSMSGPEQFAAVFGPHWKAAIGLFSVFVIIELWCAWPIYKPLVKMWEIGVAIRAARITINVSEWLTKQMMDHATRR